MKTATKNLENDHDNILQLLDVMEHISGMPQPDVSHLESIVDIIKNFADGTHHAKEENILFPLLAERGFSLSQGPVAVMLFEHVQGRNYVKGIDDNIKLYKKGTPGALEEIYKNMSGYAELLRNHIAKENNVLFRMADNVLSEDDQMETLALFDEAEHKTGSVTSSGEYIKRIRELVSFYGV